MKSRALAAGRRPQDRNDLIVLLACVDGPLALASQLTKTERGWLRKTEQALALDQLTLHSPVPPDRTRQAIAAYRLLTRT